MKDIFNHIRQILSSFYIALLFRKKKRIFINGTAMGSIKGAVLVIVKPKALCMADIEAKYLKVSGEVHGKVNVDYLVVSPRGKLKNMEIYYGKVFDFSSGYFTTNSSLHARN